MKWLSRLLDAIFRHLYSVCAGIFLFTLSVLLIVMSAQYLGDLIGENVLNNKSIEMLVFSDRNFDKSDTRNIQEFMDAIENNYNLRDCYIKIKKIDTEKRFIPKKGARILVSLDKELMEKLSQERKLMVLDRSIFANRTHKYLEFSKYDEYVLAETTVNHLKVYIAITNAETNSERVKAFRVIDILSDNIMRKVDLQPDV